VAVDGGAQQFGAVYVFVRTGGGWTQQAMLVAHDPTSLEEFGGSVSLSVDTVVVGAYRDQDQGYEAGAAYIFTRNGGRWGEEAKLAPGGAAPADRFGWSVSLSRDTVAVGAPFASGSGSVTLFHRSGGAWTETDTVFASDPSTGGRFGWSVSLDEDLLAVGAPSANEAYLFSPCGGSWREQNRLLASDGPGDRWFGFSVALSGDTVLVGAPKDSPHGTFSGSAYVSMGCMPECLLPCPRSPGYWKAHPAAWPIDQLRLGAEPYTRDELLNLLSRGPAGDASLILANQLVATYLNVVYGSDPLPVVQTAVDVDALLSNFTGRLPYTVRPSTVEGRTMIELAGDLERYNSGALTPGCIPLRE